MSWMSTIKPWIINKLGNFQWEDCYQDITHSVVVQVISTQESDGEKTLLGGKVLGGSALVHDTQMRVNCKFTQDAIEEFERIQCGVSGCEFSDLEKYLISLDCYRVIPVLSSTPKECIFIVIVYSFSYIGPVKLRNGMEDTRMAHQHHRIFRKLQELRELWKDKRLTIVSDNSDSSNKSTEDDLSQMVEYIQEMERTADVKRNAAGEVDGDQEMTEVATEGLAVTGEEPLDESLQERGRGRLEGSVKSPTKALNPPRPGRRSSSSKLTDLGIRSLTATFAIEMSLYEELKCPQHKDCLSMRPSSPPINGEDSLQEVLDDLPVMLYSCVPHDHVTQGMPEWMNPWELEGLDGPDMTGSEQAGSAVVTMETASTIRSCDSSSQPTEEGIEPLRWPPGSASLQERSSISCPASVSPDVQEAKKTKRISERGDILSKGSNSLLAPLRRDDESSPASGEKSRTLDVSQSTEVITTDSPTKTGNNISGADKNDNQVDSKVRDYRRTDSREPSVLVKDTPQDDSVSSLGSLGGQRVISESQDGEGVGQTSDHSLGIGKRLMSGLAHIERRISETIFRTKPVPAGDESTSVSEDREGVPGSSLSEDVDRLASSDVLVSKQAGGLGSNSRDDSILSPGQPLCREEDDEVNVVRDEDVSRGEPEDDDMVNGLDRNRDPPDISLNITDQSVSDSSNNSQIDSNRKEISDHGDTSTRVSFDEDEVMETQPFEVDSPPVSWVTSGDRISQPAAERRKTNDDSFPETQPFEVDELVPIQMKQNGGRHMSQSFADTVQATSEPGGPSQPQSIPDSQSQSSDLPGSVLNKAFLQTQSQGAEHPPGIINTTQNTPMVSKQGCNDSGLQTFSHCPNHSSFSSEEDIFSTCPHEPRMKPGSTMAIYGQSMNITPSREPLELSGIDTSDIQSCDEIIDSEESDKYVRHLPGSENVVGGQDVSRDHHEHSGTGVGSNNHVTPDIAPGKKAAESCPRDALTTASNQSTDVLLLEKDENLRKRVLVSSLLVQGQSSSVKLHTPSETSIAKTRDGYSRNLSYGVVSSTCDSGRIIGAEDQERSESVDQDQSNNQGNQQDQQNATSREPKSSESYERTPEQNEHERTPKKKEKDDFDLSLIFGTPVSIDEINRLLDKRYSPLLEHAGRTRGTSRMESPSKKSRKSLVSEFVAGLQGLKCSCGETMSEDSASSVCDSCQASPTLRETVSKSTIELSRKRKRDEALNEASEKVDEGHPASSSSMGMVSEFVGSPRTGKRYSIGEASRERSIYVEEQPLKGATPSPSSRKSNRKRKLSEAGNDASPGKSRRRLSDEKRAARKAQKIREGLLKMIIDEHSKLKKPKKLKRKGRVAF